MALENILGNVRSHPEGRVVIPNLSDAVTIVTLLYFYLAGWLAKLPVGVPESDLLTNTQIVDNG